MIYLVLNTSTTYYLSLEAGSYDVGIGEKFWYPYILDIDEFQYRMEQETGGFVGLKFGGFRLSPKVFESEFPPPRKATFDIYYNTTKIISGTAIITEFDEQSIDFDVYPTEYNFDLLDDAPDYGTETNRKFPIVFGNVTCFEPLRYEPGVGEETQYKFHKASIVGTDPDADYTVYDNGSALSEYDSGTGLGSVVDNGDGTFYLKLTPIGKVLMSGDNTSQNTLIEAFTWACSRMSLTLDSTKATASLSIDQYFDGQTSLTKFLSDIAASYNHIFYISGTTLYLVSMTESNGILSLGNYSDARYRYNYPLHRLKAEWSTLSPGTDGQGYPTYIEERNDYGKKTTLLSGNELIHSVYTYDTPTVSSVLETAATIFLKTKAFIHAPLAWGLVTPGTFVDWIDDRLVSASSVAIRARNIVYDLINESIKIDGEGDIFDYDVTVSDDFFTKKELVDIKGLIERIDDNKAISDGQIVTFYQDTEPTADESSYGDIWIDSDTDTEIYRYQNVTSEDDTPPLVWDEISSIYITPALLTAARAGALADSKIVTFYYSGPTGYPKGYGTAEPILADGDMLVDTGNDHNQFRYDSNTAGTTSGYKWNGTSWDSYATSIASGNKVWVDVVDIKIFKNKTYVTVSGTANEGDYLTISAAVTALASTGGTIFIKNGTYNHSAEITLPDKEWTFIGETKRKVFIEKRSAIATGKVFKGTDLTGNIKFEDINFQSEGNSTSGYYLYFNGTSSYLNLIVNDCDFDYASVAIYTRNSTTLNNLVINKCYLSNQGGWAISSQNEIINIDKSIFDNTTDGIYVYSTSTTKISINECVFDTVNRVAHVPVACDIFYFTNNKTKDIFYDHSSGVINEAIYVYLTNECSIINNEIKLDGNWTTISVPGPASYTKYAILVFKSGKSTITNNTISLDETITSVPTGKSYYIHGIYTQGYIGDMKQANVLGNFVYLKSNSPTAGATVGVTGIVASYIEKSQYSNNTIETIMSATTGLASTKGINISSNSQKLTITGNNITGNNIANSEGLRIDGDYNNITGNTTIDVTTGINNTGTGNNLTGNLDI